MFFNVKNTRVPFILTIFALSSSPGFSISEIDLGSSRIVLVPFQRFADRASFPASFENKIVLLDMKNINLCQLWGERSGETLSREDGIPKRYKEMWVDANMGVKFNNPLACGWIDVSM